MLERQHNHKWKTYNRFINTQKNTNIKKINKHNIKPQKEKRRNRMEDLQQTRYMKVDYNNTTVINTKETPVYSEPKKVFKNEFPIASVILTIVVTMMAMVFAFGF